MRCKVHFSRSSKFYDSHRFHRLRHYPQINPVHFHAEPSQSAVQGRRAGDVPHLKGKENHEMPGRFYHIMSSISVSGQSPGRLLPEEHSPGHSMPIERRSVGNQMCMFARLSNRSRTDSDVYPQHAAQRIHEVCGQRDDRPKACTRRSGAFSSWLIVLVFSQG
jgi:hypothetical protein